MKILIIDFTVDREQGHSFRKMFSGSLNSFVDSTLIVRANDLKNLPTYDTIVLTGAAIPIETRPQWHDDTEHFLKYEILKKKTPVLGVCYGAQFVAKIFGAKVIKSDMPEIGSVKVSISKQDSWLMKNISSPTFYTYHYDSIFSKFVIDNEEVKVTSTSPKCSTQAYEFEHLIVAGTQFHPEKNNEDLIKMVSRNKGNPHLINDGPITELERFTVFENFFTRVLNGKKQ